MEAPPSTYKITVGEKKFRAMVDDLMIMEKPSMVIQCPDSSKARSLRRQFYNWKENLAEMEKNFMSTIEFKVTGRTISIERKADWTPVEISGENNVPENQGEPAGSN